MGSILDSIKYFLSLRTTVDAEIGGYHSQLVYANTFQYLDC